MVFQSLEEFSTVYCDPIVKGFGIVSKAEVDEIRYSPRLIGWLLWWLRLQSLPTMWETWVQLLDWEDPLEKGRERLPTLQFWPRELHGSMGSQRVGQD